MVAEGEEVVVVKVLAVEEAPAARMEKLVPVVEKDRKGSLVAAAELRQIMEEIRGQKVGKEGKEVKAREVTAEPASGVVLVEVEEELEVRVVGVIAEKAERVVPVRTNLETKLVEQQEVVAGKAVDEVMELA